MSEARNEAQTKEEKEAIPPTQPRGRRTRWLFALVLLLSLAAVGLWASGMLATYLPDSLQPHTQRVKSHVDDSAVRHAPAIPQPPRATAVHEALPQPASADAVAELMRRIETLDQTLRELMRAQQSLRDALQTQQRMNLLLRLRWITEQDSTLPQIALAWQEIALLPGLSEEQHQQALALQQTARRDAERILKWRHTLGYWAEHLATPEQPDLIPRPEQPWLAWLARQFHLRRAAPMADQERHTLAHELRRAALALQLEQWPEQASWQRLRARLMLLAQEFGVELDLPDTFADIAQDKHKLKAAAQTWLQGVQ
ncbi:MAG: hypothetical protein D6678_07645 [Zetaproteobacteria bacterium]|nr:MAG: hypothetical protein D6678_07645 [Zetaproteobacteria bacterium]